MSIPVNMTFHQLEGSTIEIVLAVLLGLQEIIFLAKSVRGLCALKFSPICLLLHSSGNIKNNPRDFINIEGTQNVTF